MNELETPQENWDFRKIFILVLFLGLFGFGFKTYFLDTTTVSNLKREVEGVNITKSQKPDILPKEEIQREVQDKIVELTQEVNKINVVEIATSTPAVQKVLNDIKNLQNLPQSEAKKACFKICEGIQ